MHLVLVLTYDFGKNKDCGLYIKFDCLLWDLSMLTTA